VRLARRGWPALAVGALLSLLLVAAAPARAARAPVPRSFYGVVPQGQLAASDFARMRGVVGTLRVPVIWSQIEPRPGHFEFAGLDATVVSASAEGVRVLPFVYGTPAWLSTDPARPPLSSRARAAWAGFLRVLVRRYGSGGELWRGSSTPLPVRSWQIWNEPNFLLFWRPRPSAVGYARLLDVSARAIRGADPGARIVAAGLAPVEGGMLPWVFLRRLLGVPGAIRHFDMVAVHPYASHLRDVALQVRLAREAMARAGGARMPLLVSELGVASNSQLPTSFNRGRIGQARFLRSAFRLLLRNRARWHIAGIDWYAWQDAQGPDPHCVFCEYAGLFDANGAPKPAWGAFRHIATASHPGLDRVR
jgi:polysaccharide biosynthesis protein PslG